MNGDAGEDEETAGSDRANAEAVESDYVLAAANVHTAGVVDAMTVYDGVGILYVNETVREHETGVVYGGVGSARAEIGRGHESYESMENAASLSKDECDEDCAVGYGAPAHGHHAGTVVTYGAGGGAASTSNSRKWAWRYHLGMTRQTSR